MNTSDITFLKNANDYKENGNTKFAFGVNWKPYKKFYDRGYNIYSISYESQSSPLIPKDNKMRFDLSEDFFAYFNGELIYRCYDNLLCFKRSELESIDTINALSKLKEEKQKLFKKQESECNAKLKARAEKEATEKAKRQVKSKKRKAEQDKKRYIASKLKANVKKFKNIFK